MIINTTNKIINVLNILSYEGKTLLKGCFFAFLVVFPFTFIPSLIKHGFALDALKARLPDAALYALGFAIIVVLASLIQNYNTLIAKEKIFKKPAFKALEFQGRVNGLGSLSYELQTLLLGKLENYYFALSIPNPEEKQHTVEFIPLIETDRNKELVENLIVNHGFSKNQYLSVLIPFSEEEFNDKEAIENVILGLDNTLTLLNTKPKSIKN